jgi:hypothetical protein
MDRDCETGCTEVDCADGVDGDEGGLIDRDDSMCRAEDSCCAATSEAVDLGSETGPAVASDAGDEGRRRGTGGARA